MIELTEEDSAVLKSILVALNRATFEKANIIEMEQVLKAKMWVVQKFNDLELAKAGRSSKGSPSSVKQPIKVLETKPRQASRGKRAPNK